MSKLTIIAEIGINHNGDINKAKRLIDIAVECGCDAVKFQKRTIDVVYTKEELDKYRESPWGTTNREQKYGLEFEKTEYDEIDRYCKEKDIDWFASAWDLGSQKFLQQYNLKYNKIASALLTYDDLLEMVAKEVKLTYISTGMSTLEQIDYAVDIFRKYNCPFAIMHCNSTYPCDNDKCNIKFIPELQKRYPDAKSIGYSGHERGLLPSVLSVVFGATVIERHICLRRNDYGSDQSSSLEKQGLMRVVRDVREVHKILGEGKKIVYDEEKTIAKKLRKH